MSRPKIEMTQMKVETTYLKLEILQLYIQILIVRQGLKKYQAMAINIGKLFTNSLSCQGKSDAYTKIGINCSVCN